ncbi:MAG: NAD-dependent epimerase/dehydratase family protein [Chloroflexi bacterium]|nr:NAD-dependent epimerase/dehydratase family protein [Chloroflexota bacterium]
MRAFVTGGIGFIGAELLRQLRARGDEVVAVIRHAGRGDRLHELGCELVEDDLATMPQAALTYAMRGSDGVFHLAGRYRIGIRATEHLAMYAANVVATQRVLDVAMAVGTPRITCISTVNAYGNTKGRVVDETYRREQPPRFLSYYDQTKYLAHLEAEDRIAAGAPISIALPAQVYGPHDPSQFGGTIAQALAGTLPAITFPDLGLNVVHVEDLAAGILLIHDRGRIGEQYILGGENTTVREMVQRAAAAAGRRPPRLRIPTVLLRGIAPLGGLIGPAMGVAPNLAEVIGAADDVTYWATDAKARRELGYQTRDLDAGLRTLLRSRSNGDGPAGMLAPGSVGSPEGTDAGAAGASEK